MATLLTKELVAVFIACSTAIGNEYAHTVEEIKKFPPPPNKKAIEELEEDWTAELYCFTCGTHCASGRSGVKIDRCPDCGINAREQFAHAYQVSRVILDFNSVQHHTLFNQFLDWCCRKPEIYAKFRAQIKAPRKPKTLYDKLLGE